MRSGAAPGRLVGGRRHVPRLIAADDLDLALLAEERRTSAARHDRAHFPQQFDAHAAGVVVDQGRVVLDGDARPRVGGCVVLSHREVRAGTDDLQGLGLCGAHRGRRFFERRLLRACGGRKCKESR
jgi:hypothetical protein